MRHYSDFLFPTSLSFVSSHNPFFRHTSVNLQPYMSQSPKIASTSNQTRIFILSAEELDISARSADSLALLQGMYMTTGRSSTVQRLAARCTCSLLPALPR